MAVVIISKPPAGVPMEGVRAVAKEMDIHNDPPAGLIVHTAIERDGGVEIIDVWDSEEAFRTFESQRLIPAIEKVMAGMGAPTDGPPAEHNVFEVGDLVRGR
jgi:hypothetical protein